MKFGIRTPNVKKRIKARTTGKLKRKVKKATIPMYGKKGTGIIKNPKKALYNKVYNKTSISVDDIISKSADHSPNINYPNSHPQKETALGCLTIIVAIVGIIATLLLVAMIIACIAFLIYLFF